MEHAHKELQLRCAACPRGRDCARAHCPCADSSCLRKGQYQLMLRRLLFWRVIEAVDDLAEVHRSTRVGGAQHGLVDLLRRRRPAVLRRASTLYTISLSSRAAAMQKLVRLSGRPKHPEAPAAGARPSSPAAEDWATLKEPYDLERSARPNPLRSSDSSRLAPASLEGPYDLEGSPRLDPLRTPHSLRSTPVNLEGPYDLEGSARPDALRL